MIPNMRYATADGKNVEQPPNWDEVQAQALHELVFPNTPVKLFVRIELDPDLNPQKDTLALVKAAASFVGRTLNINSAPDYTSTTPTTHELRYPDYVLADTKALMLVWSHLHTEAERCANPSELRVMRRVDGAVREQWIFCFGAIPHSIKAPQGPDHLLHNVATPPSYWPIPAGWKQRVYPGEAALVGGPGRKMKAPFEHAKALVRAVWPDRNPGEIASVTPMHASKENKLMPKAVRIVLTAPSCYCENKAPNIACSYVDVHGEDGKAEWHCDHCHTVRTEMMPTSSEAVYRFLKRYWSIDGWMDALNATYTQLADATIVERMVDDENEVRFLTYKEAQVAAYLRGHKYVQWTATKKKRSVGRPKKDAVEAAEEQEWSLHDVFSDWTKSLDRARCKAKIFNPARPPGRHRDFLNMYEGFGMEPKEPATRELANAAPLLRAHVREVICHGSAVEFEFLETCLAQLVQYPWRKLGIVFVLKAKEGAGKNTLLDVLRKIFGRHGIEVTSAKHVTGNFNNHLQNKIIVVLNEAVWGGDKQSEGTLKASITESFSMFEPKGVDAKEGTNYWTFFISSNEKWCIPASADSRRYHMLPVSDHRIGDKAYFSALHKAIAEGEDREYMWYLQHRPCQHPYVWQPCHNMPPRTRAFVEQMMQDRKQALLRFLVGQLEEDGEWIYPTLGSPIPIIQRGRTTNVAGRKVLDALRSSGDMYVRMQLVHQRNVSAFLKETLGDSLFNSRARFSAAEQPVYTTNDKCYNFASAEDIMQHLSNEVLGVPDFFARPDEDLQPEVKRLRPNDEDANDE